MHSVRPATDFIFKESKVISLLSVCKIYGEMNDGSLISCSLQARYFFLEKWRKPV
jgi:hypothetical protein